MTAFQLNPENKSEKPVKKGDILRVFIESTGLEGKSICRENDFVIFADGGIPGDEAEIQITKVKSNYAEARVLSILHPGPSRTTPECSHFGTCGGCKWQHFRYEDQLIAKTRHVEDAMSRIGGFSDMTVLPAIGSVPHFRYRNKMDFTFSNNRWILKEETAAGLQKPTDFALGFHLPGRFDKIVDIDHCHLQTERANQILIEVKTFASQSGLEPWDIKHHTGFWRSLIIREAFNTNELVVILVTSRFDSNSLSELADILQKRIDGITGIVQINHSGKGPVPKNEGSNLLAGNADLTEILHDVRFQIHPESFFQTNSKQAEVLFNTALNMVDFQPDDLVFDLFCGPGTIGLLAANSVKRVVGMELVPEAVANAIENARLNSIPNAEFFTGDLANPSGMLTDWIQTYGKPDVVIVDPPRAGLADNLCRLLPEFHAEKILYISCNPVTQARDLKILAEMGYTTNTIQPVDMFPHTFHIESIAVLKRISDLKVF